ncbi:MAG: xanthine dehydrogenase FAD-binding subunit XdhB [Peptococcaceae bacterium]|nr:xanthine dehydrogenase FAD-binding subunit XdhB [Peptococcaceae bacterium]
MYDIKNYVEATSVAEATALLAQNPELRIIAGGTDVLIKMQHGSLVAAELLSIRSISALTNITMAEDGIIRIGALASFTLVHQNKLVEANLMALREAALSMGGPQIRNVATIGGNICNGVTSADSAPILFALDAVLKLENASGSRLVPITEFYRGPGQVALAPDEMLTEIQIEPASYVGCGSHYIKFAMRNAMDIATLGVAVVCRVKDGCFDQVRIGLGVAGPTPLRCLEAEAYAVGQPVNQATIGQIGQLALNSTRARTSWRASKEYREHLVTELTQRALKVAIVRAGGAELA